MMNYKFNEDKLIRELKEYVDKTYDQHYATDKYQATDVIIDSGHGTGKGDAPEQRKDLMKILHYALIQLHIHDEKNLSTEKSAPFHHSGVYHGDDGNYHSIDNVTPEEWNGVR